VVLGGGVSAAAPKVLADGSIRPPEPGIGAGALGAARAGMLAAG
jgi:hypothetical protein